MSYIRDLFTFLGLVITNWAGYTTGGLIMALVALWSTLQQIPVSRKVGAALAVVFLFLAVFKAWRDQYRQVNALKEDVPELRGFIDQVNSAEIELKDKRHVAALLIVLSIRNLRSPSIAHNYSCHVTFKNKRYDGMLQLLEKTATLMDERGVATPLSMEPIYLKTFETPIGRGAMKRGVLQYNSPDAPERFTEGAHITVSFDDVRDETYSAELTLSGTGQGERVYHPGATLPSG